MKRLCSATRLTALFGLTCLIFSQSAHAQRPVAATHTDYYVRGTQPGTLALSGNDPIVDPVVCGLCHTHDSAVPASADFFKDWSGTMMAQSMRDPVFRAAMQVAQSDVAGSGELCMRCHTPSGFLEGRAGPTPAAPLTPTDGSALTSADYDGISCNFCHRNVAIAAMGNECDTTGSTCIDADIRQALSDNGNLPFQDGSGGYVVDPLDRRRGPFADAICDFFHTKEVRELFLTAAVCGNCHDVSNPVLVKSGSTYVLGALNQPHPTGNKYDMFPVERTFSEWSNSAYAQPGGVNSGGRFGGNNPVVDVCQSCHMPRGRGDQAPLQGCFIIGTPQRLNLPMHEFLGANTWVPDVLPNLYPADVDPAALLAAKARNTIMLGNAAELQITPAAGSQAKVRVINHAGHKLPTGYMEGRRMWLNVTIKDCQGVVLAEYGRYDAATADLNTAGTKVYEAHAGLDAVMAAATGLPAGPSFHFALNNTLLFDNRIPPLGFTNAAFAAVQAAPVGTTYADGQNWDDTLYPVPSGAATVQADLYYQTSSKSYVEFLRDNNPLPVNDPNNMGQTLYNQWLITGKSTPVRMVGGLLNLIPRGDLTGDTLVTTADVPPFVNVLLGLDTDPAHRCATDMNVDGNVDGTDIQSFVQALLP